MGAIYDRHFIPGTKTGPQVRSEFYTLQYQHEADIARAVRELIANDDDYDDSDFDSLYGDYACYGGNYVTLDYIELSRKRFKSLDLADDYMLGEEEPISKWSNALAAKVLMDEKTRKEHGVEADKNGYVWCIFSLLAC